MIVYENVIQSFKLFTILLDVLSLQGNVFDLGGQRLSEVKGSCSQNHKKMSNTIFLINYKERLN